MAGELGGAFHSAGRPLRPWSQRRPRLRRVSVCAAAGDGRRRGTRPGGRPRRVRADGYSTSDPAGWRAVPGPRRPNEAAGELVADEALAVKQDGALDLSFEAAARPPWSERAAYIWPRLLLLGVAGVWGTNFGSVKLIQEAMPISTAAALRFCLAGAAVAPVLLRPRLQIPREIWANGALCGFFISVGYATQSISLATTPANKSAFLCSLAVVVVPFVERLLNQLSPDTVKHPGRPSRSPAWISPLLAVLGVGILELAGSDPIVAGDLWGLAQAVGFGFGFVLNEKILARFPQHSLSLSAIQLEVVAAVSVLMAFLDPTSGKGVFHLPNVASFLHNPQILLIVLHTGLLSTALSVILENVALERVTASELSVLLSTEPFWAAAFSAVVLGESLGPEAFIGGIIIACACLWSQLGDSVALKVSQLIGRSSKIHN